VPSVAPSAVASFRHPDAVRNGAAKSEWPHTPFEVLLETQPDPAGDSASVRGDDRTLPQTARCEPPSVADRSCGLANSKPMDRRQARAIPAKDSEADETDAVAVQDAVIPDADAIEADAAATLLDPGSPAVAAASDPAASPEILVNPPTSPANSTTTPVAVVMPVNADVVAMTAAPIPSEGETTALSPALAPAAPVNPAIVTAAASHGVGAVPSADPATTPAATHPAAPAVAATVQAQSPEHSSAAAQLPDFIAQATPASTASAAVPASPATPATPANPQAGTAASPAIPATPANPAHAAPARSGNAQDATQSPSVSTESSAPNRPDDAPRPAGDDPVPARLRNAAAKTGEVAGPAISRAGREAAPGGANPVDYTSNTQGSGTPTVSAGATNEANGQSKPGAPRQHDLPEPAETLLPPGASETRPASATPFAAGHDVTGADPLRSVSAPITLGGAPAAIAGATPANAPYAMASSAPVPISGLAVEFVSRVRNGNNRFEIRLDPPELGRIDVHLKVDRDGNVTSRLVVERAETLDLLRRDAPSLERALHNAGLKTGEQGLEFSLRNQAFDRDQSGRNESGASRLIIPDEVQPSGPITGGYSRRFGIGGGIDIRV
jgi:flagellar hook-length control protein FliK